MHQNEIVTADDLCREIKQGRNEMGWLCSFSAAKGGAMVCRAEWSAECDGCEVQMAHATLLSAQAAPVPTAHPRP